MRYLKAIADHLRTWNEYRFIILALPFIYLFYAFLAPLLAKIGIPTGVFGAEAIQAAVLAVVIVFFFMAMVFAKIRFWKWLWRWFGGTENSTSLKRDWSKAQGATRIRTAWYIFFGLLFAFILVFMSIMGAGAMKWITP